MFFNITVIVFVFFFILIIFRRLFVSKRPEILIDNQTYHKWERCPYCNDDLFIIFKMDQTKNIHTLSKFNNQMVPHKCENYNG